MKNTNPDLIATPVKEFELNFENRTHYLFVKGTGIRRTLHSILESTQELTQIMETSKSKFILLDYAELTTIISNSDIFNITRLYETKTPLLYQLCISIIINPNEIHMEKFWEEICRKRGFNFKIFSDAPEAEKWLLEQSAKS